MIDYANRPFSRVGKMNYGIISNYRKVIKDTDLVYILGDVTIVGPQHRASIEHFLSQLPGTKILILGNHDKFDPFTYVDMGFQSVHTSLDIGEFILVHDPAVSMVNVNRNWLCGHIHTLFKRRKNVLNVGVDQWGFFPVSIEEVRKEFEHEDI